MPTVNQDRARLKRAIATANRQTAKELERQAELRRQAKITLTLARWARKHPHAGLHSVNDRLDVSMCLSAKDDYLAKRQPRSVRDWDGVRRSDMPARFCFLSIDAFYDGIPLAHLGGDPLRARDRATFDLGVVNMRVMRAAMRLRQEYMDAVASALDGLAFNLQG